MAAHYYDSRIAGQKIVLVLVVMQDAHIVRLAGLYLGNHVDFYVRIAYYLTFKMLGYSFSSNFHLST